MCNKEFSYKKTYNAIDMGDKTLWTAGGVKAVVF